MTTLDADFLALLNRARLAPAPVLVPTVQALERAHPAPVEEPDDCDDAQRIMRAINDCDVLESFELDPTDVDNIPGIDRFND